MLVTTLAHAALVKKRFEKLWRLRNRRYFAVDTETKAKAGYPAGDALVIGRADVTFFSICYAGEAYSFPTSYFDSKYPTPEEWGACFRDWMLDQSIIKVMHNANYDLNATYYSMEWSIVRNIWDTMIGAWKASEYRAKGLKERAFFYGRAWRPTKSVDFSKLTEVAEYAETDVVQTDELFQMQRYGFVSRPSVVFHIDASGFLVRSPINLPAGRLVLAEEVVSQFDQLWLRYLEFPVLRATVRAERRGFPIDVTELRKIRRRVNFDLRKSLKIMYRMAGRVLNLNSGKQISEVAEELEIENPIKTKKGADCWDAKALSKLRGIHPFIDALINFRAMQKLSSVYIGKKDLDKSEYAKSDSGLEYYIANDGCIHCTMSTVAAITGRNSASNPNLQQIPARKDRYAIKHVFVAVPVGVYIPTRFRRDAQLIVLDYSQLEIRVMALLCDDPKMLEVLRDPKGDIHLTTANEFGIARDPHAKILNFLLLYGGGAYMLAENLTFMGVSTSQSETAVYVENHKQVYPRVFEYRQELLQHHKEDGYVKLWTGRRRTMPDIDWDNKHSIHKAETTLSNNVVQGSGQDFLKASIVRADYNCISPDRELPKYLEMPREHKFYLKDKAVLIDKYRATLKRAECKFRLQVHDEAVYTVHPSAAEECLAILADIMSWRHYFPSIKEYSVPIVAEGGVGRTWKDAKSKDTCLYHCKSGYKEFEDYAD